MRRPLPKLFLTRESLLGKRVVGTPLGLLVHVLAPHHIVIPETVKTKLIDQIIEVGSIFWLARAKIIDHYQEAKAGTEFIQAHEAPGTRAGFCCF